MQLKFLLRAFGVHVKKVRRVNVRREKPHTHTPELMHLCVQFNAYLVFHRIFSMQSKFIHKKCARNTHTLSYTQERVQHCENTENFCNKLNRLFEVSNENKLFKHSIEIEVKQKQVMFLLPGFVVCFFSTFLL